MPDNSRILVTGGAGYIGSLLVPELLSIGHHVTVIDNFMYRQTSLLQNCSNRNFDVINGDVRNHALISEVLPKFDVIMPLAAIVGAPACSRDPIAVGHIHVEAIKHMVSKLSVNQKVIYPVTNSGYGIGIPGKLCNEESPLNPVSLYGSSKVEAERIIKNFSNSITFRLATVFGLSPRMRIDLLVNEFVYRAVFDRSIVLFESNFKRNFIHVRDVVRTFVWGLNNFDGNSGETFNVGLSSANLSKMELCQAIKKFLPNFEIFEAEIGTDPDKRDYIVSNEKLENRGWAPKFSLEDGILELIMGYRMIRNGAGFDNL